MNPKRRFAEALRVIANRLDPPPKTRELGIDLRPIEVERLAGFDQTEPVSESPDWTWTQGSRPMDGGYL